MTRKKVDSKTGLGRRIQDRMNERKMTEKDLVEASGLPRSFINAVIRGQSKSPNANGLAQIAKALDLKYAELLLAGGLEEKYLPNDELGRPEPLDFMLKKAMLALPESIPLYSEHPLEANKYGIYPQTYIPSYKWKDLGRFEAYYAPGQLEPEVQVGDIMIVTQALPQEEGAIVACLYNNEFVIGKLNIEDGKKWIANNQGKLEYSQCDLLSLVVEIRRITYKRGRA